MALFPSLCQFRHLPNGFTNASLRPLVAAHLGQPNYSSRHMTCDLRRSRRKGFIVRTPDKRRNILTHQGRRMAFFFAKTCARILQPGLNQLDPTPPPSSPCELTRSWHAFKHALTRFIQRANLTPGPTLDSFVNF